MIYGHGDDAYLYESIKMDFSSNIYGHADLSALKDHLARHLDVIGHYPEPESGTLEREIASRRGVPADSVIVTNGATDAIYLIAQALASLGITHFTVKHPTFSEYADACRLSGLHETAETGFHTSMWLCNPNNPTGETLQPVEVLRLAAAYGLLILDQSYEDYTERPLLSAAEAAGSSNIIQIYSMTKTYSVPGLRIGYLIAHPRLATSLRTFLRPWSVNALAIEAGRWLIRNESKAIPDKTGYLVEAQRLWQGLSSIPGIDVRPTTTNFMLCRIAGRTAAELKHYLATECHILIRDASNFDGLDAHHFRVAAQTREENEALIRAIQTFITQKRMP